MYLRPSEAFRLRVQDIVKPVRKGSRGYRHYSILLHPMEEGVPSKTLQRDEMLALDLEYQKWLGPALVKTLRLDHRQKEHLAFNITQQQVIDFMGEHWEALGLKTIGEPHMYRLRHGGASHDAVCHYRPLAEIQTRGRWMSLKSVRNYEKGNRLMQLFGSLSPDVQRRATEAAIELPRMFRCRL